MVPQPLPPLPVHSTTGALASQQSPVSHIIAQHWYVHVLQACEMYVSLLQ